MISRRELLLSSAALAAAPPPRRITNDFRVRDCVVRLEDAAVSVLTGIPAKELAALDELGQNRETYLDIGVQGSTGILRFEDLPPRRLDFINGGEGFVTAWAYPISFHGIIGYQPSLDLPVLLQHGDGEFLRLPFERMPTPARLREARGLHVAFLSTRHVTMQQLNDRILKIQACASPDADLVVTSNVEPHLEPCVCVSLFGTRG